MRMIHPSPTSHAFIVALLIFSITAHAGQRLPGELIMAERQASPLLKLLEAPARNLQKIKGLYLVPGDGTVASATDSIKKALDRPCSPEDKAALHVLLANAIKSRELDANMPDRKNGNSLVKQKISSSVLAEVFGESEDAFETMHALVSPLLDDFLGLNEVPTNSKLRSVLVETMNSLLADHRITESLSDLDKSKILEKYLRSDRKPLASCKPEQIMAIYRNWGLAEEIKKICTSPFDGKETMVDLEYRMKLAASASLENETIACADRLLELFSNKMTVSCHDSVIAEYARFRPNEALEKFKDKCNFSPLATVILYRTACSVNQYGSEAKRRHEWLDPFVSMAEKYSTENGIVDRGKHLGRLHAFAFELMNSDCPDAALYVANKTLETKALLGERRIVGMFQIVERCNKKLGRNKDTVKIITNFLEYKELNEAARHFISNRINSTDNKQEK